VDPVSFALKWDRLDGKVPRGSEAYDKSSMFCANPSPEGTGWLEEPGEGFRTFPPSPLPVSLSYVILFSTRFLRRPFEYSP
jgi:hypothetical protein